MIIRELRTEDVEPLCAIESRAFSMPWSAADFARLIRDRDSLYLVAEEDGRVVGNLENTLIFFQPLSVSMAILEN